MKSILLLPLLLLVSCKDSATNVESPSDNLDNQPKQMISADELMQSLGGSDFHVVIPDDIDSTSMVGLAFKYPNGKIDNFGGSSHWKPGEKVRVVIFSPNEGNPRYSIVSNNGTIRGTLPTRFNHNSWSTSKPLYKTGESLIRFSTDGTVSGGGEVDSDDVDLILYVKPKKMDKSQ